MKDCAAGQTGAVVAFTLLFRGSTRGLGCCANCDNSTAPPCLNINDFACFLNAFVTGEEYANCDDSYIAPHLNANDFVCFMGNMAAGCDGMACSPRP